MDNKLEKRVGQLKNKYLKSSVDTVEIIEIDGIKLFNRKQMQEILGLSDTQIKDYENRDMPRSKYSMSNYILYELKQVVDWIAVNVDHTKSKRGKKQSQNDELPEDINENDWKSRNERAVALRNEELAKEAELKVKELKGELVRKEDTDKSLAELGATMSAYYRNDLKSLPVLLENQSHIDIKENLNAHYRDRMEDMSKVVSTQIEINDESVYDKLIEWIRQGIK